MKKILWLSFLMTVASLSAPINAVSDPSIYNEIIDVFQASAEHWQPIFTQTALYIFYVLAAVQLAWEFGTMAARGEFEFGGVASALIRTIVIFGIFKFLLISPDIFISWFDSFNELADRANTAAGGADIIVGDIFASAANLFKITFSKFSLWSIGKSIGLVLTSIISALLLISLGIELIITIIKFYFSLYINIIMLGFAPLAATRQWPINGITNMIKIGLEVMIIKLIIGLGITSISTFTMEVKDGNNDSLIYLIILVYSLFSLAKMTHGMVESFFHGFLASNSPSGGQIAKAVMAGTLGGAMASMNNNSSTNNSTTQTNNTNSTDNETNSMLPKSETTSSLTQTAKSAVGIMGSALIGGVAGGIDGATRVTFGEAPKQHGVPNGYKATVENNAEASSNKFNTEYRLGDNNE